MIINNWYVAADTDDLKDEPIKVRMLGVDLVLFRDGDGNIACLSNTCCHRGGSLSRGVVNDGCVSCPYHGWQYDKSGCVTKIPALGDDIKIPKRARVDSYPVQERYGYIWVFLGDKSAADRLDFPHLLPEYDDTETWRILRVQNDWDVNWMRLGENLVDSSHLPYVHDFGKYLSRKMKIYPIEERDWGAESIQKTDDTPDSSLVTLEFSLIGMMQKNRMDLAPGVTSLAWHAWTPIDEGHTRLFGLRLRNVDKDPKYDEERYASSNHVAQEDIDLVSYLAPVVTPPTNANELTIETDGMETLFRRKTQELRRKLGAIDSRKLEQERKYKVLVIPSPARGQDSSNWVHDTVPLIHVGDDDVSSAAAE